MFGAQVDLALELDGLLGKIAQANPAREQGSMQHHLDHRELLADACAWAEGKWQVTKTIALRHLRRFEPVRLEALRV